MMPYWPFRQYEKSAPGARPGAGRPGLVRARQA